MKTKWILQNNIYTDDLENIKKNLVEIDRPFECVDVIPFSKELHLTAHHKGPVIAYGSTTLIKLVSENWVWYDKNTFKPSIWGKMIEDKYLNNDAEILRLKDVLSNWKYKRAFIRPNSDLKLFCGTSFMSGDFKDWYSRVKSLVDSGTYVNLNLDTEVSVSEYKKIIHEWRYFIVNKKIAAGSRYRENGKLKPSATVDFGSFSLAYDIANMEWQLAPAYVVDIALTDNGKYKIIEFNNFNSSGFYKCNIKDILLKSSIFQEEKYNAILF